MYITRFKLLRSSAGFDAEHSAETSARSRIEPLQRYLLVHERHEMRFECVKFYDISGFLPDVQSRYNFYEAYCSNFMAEDSAPHGMEKMTMALQTLNPHQGTINNMRAMLKQTETAYEECKNLPGVARCKMHLIYLQSSSEVTEEQKLEQLLALLLDYGEDQPAGDLHTLAWDYAKRMASTSPQTWSTFTLIYEHLKATSQRCGALHQSRQWK